MEQIFNYNSTIPRVGEGVNQTQIRFQPQGWYGSGATARPNNYIRFDFRTNGFWDPLATFINIEIESDSLSQGQLLQLDGSAQSIIGQYIARHNGVELIRIQEYDEMASFLYDINYDISSRSSRSSEGVGMKDVDITRFQRAAIFPEVYDIRTVGMATSFPDIPNSTKDQINVSLAGFRPWWAGQAIMPDVAFYAGQVTSKLDHIFPASFMDSINACDAVGCETFSIGQPSQTVSAPFYTNHGPFYQKVSDGGFVRFDTESCVGSGEPFLSNYIPRPTIKCGVPCYDYTSRATFQIPLLCPIFGALAEHKKFLPMRLFDGLEFEFLINPYAFFSGGGSWNKTTSSTYIQEGMHSVGTFNEAPYDPATLLGGGFNMGYDPTILVRNRWTITKFEIVTEITTPELGVMNSINSQAESNFVLDFKSWYLGPRNKFTGGDSLSTDIQINNGFDSLNMLLFYFQPSDYEIYPFCRKHKRISNNLSSMQLRIGNTYIPSLPITGHAGNIKPDWSSTVVKSNYTEFFIQTMKAFGKWLRTTGTGIINKTNYTLNTIGYDPTQVSYTFGEPNKTPETVFDMSLWWENQIIPRNLFAIDLQRFEGTNTRSGWDTTRMRPFNLNLKNDNSAFSCFHHASKWDYGTAITKGKATNVTVTNVAFPRPYYLYIWMYHDARISFSPERGWIVEGRV